LFIESSVVLYFHRKIFLAAILQIIILKTLQCIQACDFDNIFLVYLSQFFNHYLMLNQATRTL